MKWNLGVHEEVLFLRVHLSSWGVGTSNCSTGLSTHHLWMRGDLPPQTPHLSIGTFQVPDGSQQRVSVSWTEIRLIRLGRSWQWGLCPTGPVSWMIRFAQEWVSLLGNCILFSSRLISLGWERIGDDKVGGGFNPS